MRRALLVIFLVALALRAVGLAFAHTQPLARPDEELFALEAMGMFTRGYQRLVTGWPGGFFALWHLVLRGERAAYGDVSLPCLLAVKPAAVLVPMRAVSALLSAATVVPVFALGRALRNERAGLFAALAFAVNFLVGRDGHFGVSDALVVLLVASCLAACEQRATLWAAGFAGAALGVKYSAAALALPCAVAAFRDRRRLLPAVLVGLVAFLAVSPQVLRDPGAFWSGFTSHGARYGAQEGPSGLTYYAATVLPAAFGVFGAILAALGLALSRARATQLFTVGFFVVALAPLQLVFARYASPLVPALCAGLAYALETAVETSRPLGALVALAALLPPAARLARFDALLLRPDTRDLASAQAVLTGMPIETRGGWAHVHALEAGARDACTAALPAKLRAPVPLLAGSSQPWRDLVAAGPASWEELGQKLLPRSLDRAPLPDARLALTAEAPWFQNISRAPPLDLQCWVETQRLAGGPAGERFDGFFASFPEPGDAERPGPGIVARLRRCDPGISQSR